jgi:SAM-dependent methyltransferase
MALILRDYLKDGIYEGVDIAPNVFEWCKNNLTPKYSNINFRHIDIYSKLYNPDGMYQASEYKFQYESGSFDFILLASLFTHMLPEGMKNYFSEISRLLKPGGKCLITFFLINIDSFTFLHFDKQTYRKKWRDKFAREPHILEFDERFNFQYQMNGYRTDNIENPEDWVAYDETVVEGLYKQNGLKINMIHYGSWCGRHVLSRLQDYIIATKE